MTWRRKKQIVITRPSAKTEFRVITQNLWVTMAENSSNRIVDGKKHILWGYIMATRQLLGLLIAWLNMIGIEDIEIYWHFSKEKLERGLMCILLVITQAISRCSHKRLVKISVSLSSKQAKYGKTSLNQLEGDCV